jgi:folylpolyglutamate synthase/dihydropteroate synthase
MIQSSLELIKAIQSDYEREAERMRLLKLAKTFRRTSPFITKFEGITHLAFRLFARKRTSP